MSGWYLEQLSIEGFRGINNQGAPLILKLKPDHVNSISAPNGVGKTSIFDAIVYAITGRLQKLDEMPAAEQGSSYYLNRFHSGGIGTVGLTLRPALGGNAVTVTVTRDAQGNRSVNATGTADGPAILNELNRDFVLLDGKTFQEFIELKPLERGRSFAGLLGLKKYSTLRQTLAGISNTRSFNNHFSVTAKKAAKDSSVSVARREEGIVKEAYAALVGEVLDPTEDEAKLLAKAHSALHGIDLLKPHCDGKQFHEIDPSACIDAAKAKEGGDDREKLSQALRTETAWADASRVLPNAEDAQALIDVATARDAAMAQTRGDLFHRLFTSSEAVLLDDEWSDKTVCPTCDRVGDNSVLAHVQEKIAAFDAVEQASAEVARQWADKGWGQLLALEGLALVEGEPAELAAANASAVKGILSAELAAKLTAHVGVLTERATLNMASVAQQKLALEKALPPLLTAVVEKAEAARRLQNALKELKTARGDIAAKEAELARIERVRKFLDQSCKSFADAESKTATRRLAAIEPSCREIFKAIMYEDVVPSLKKREGSEELAIALAEFWTLQDVSAQALLSESFRNAFAISVYLAAASLYGGGAKFLVLDDVTSSFDSGHQLHLMNVIRDTFARPGVADGPQVILLSHDSVLEKLFNTNAQSGDWWHQCIQGTARTAVLPQSGAVNKVKEATLAHLDAGNTDDAAPRIRQYLEFKLQEVISKLGIAVPSDIAYRVDRQMPQNLLDAIEAQVELHSAAGKLIMDPAQVTGMNASIATIVGNYVTHWATGQTHTFTAGSLRGVMHAIDNYAACFTYEDPAGSGQKRYYRSLSRKT